MRADDIFSRRGLEARLWAAGIILGDLKEAAEAARAGNPRIRRIFTAFGSDLGEFLDPFVLKFRAQVVLVLGQIAGAFDLFGPALYKALSKPALPGERGADAALLGAADLLFYPVAPSGAQETT
jgi:glucokinase